MPQEKPPERLKDGRLDLDSIEDRIGLTMRISDLRALITELRATRGALDQLQADIGEDNQQTLINMPRTWGKTLRCYRESLQATRRRPGEPLAVVGPEGCWELVYKGTLKELVEKGLDLAPRGREGIHGMPEAPSTPEGEKEPMAPPQIPDHQFIDEASDVPKEIYEESEARIEVKAAKRDSAKKSKRGRAPLRRPLRDRIKRVPAHRPGDPPPKTEKPGRKP